MATVRATGIISKWALQQWSSRNAMCDKGQRVFDIVQKLERKGKSAHQIVEFFRKTHEKALKDDPNAVDPFDFIAQGLSPDDGPCYEDNISDLESLTNGYANGEAANFSPEFLKALEKEIERLEVLQDELEEQGAVGQGVSYQNLPVFREIKGNVRVSIRPKRRK